MGAKVSNQKNLLIPEQAEEVIEYEGYEEFPVIEVAKHSATKIENIRPNPSLNNHSGGSSIGKYESENFVNKSKDKVDNTQDENAKSKEESKFIKEKTDKKDEDNNNNINNDNNENNGNNIILVNSNNIEDNNKPEKIEENIDILRSQNNNINNNINQVEINLEEKNPEENDQNNGGINIKNEINGEINNMNNDNEDMNQNYNNYNNGISEIKEEDINYNENDEKEKEKLNTDNNINNENNNNDFTEEKKIENEELNNNKDINNKDYENNLNNKEINNLELKNETQANMNNNNTNDELGPKKIILPDITTIISEKVLEEGAGNELLFMSYLNQIVHISIKERVIYSQKFCITSKDNFLIYENKENYIQVKKPLAIVPISSIKNVVLFKLSKKVANYDHFYIEFELDENNRNNIYDRIDTFYENDLNNKTNENLTNTALVMFKTEERNLAKEWYVLLKFLIDLKLKK